MSDNNSVLTWHSGDGWLVLCGGLDPLSEIRALALTRMTLVGGAACVSLDDDDEDALEDLGELGGPTGYLVNILIEDDDTIRARLKDAGLVLLPHHDDPQALRSALVGAAVEGILDAFERGAVILAEGSSAALLGEMMVYDDEAAPGLGWVVDTAIVPAVTTLAESASARFLLAAHRVSKVIGIGVGSALVLGPGGHIETWGHRQVTVALNGPDAGL